MICLLFFIHLFVCGLGGQSHGNQFELEISLEFFFVVFKYLSYFALVVDRRKSPDFLKVLKQNRCRKLPAVARYIDGLLFANLCVSTDID